MRRDWLSLLTCPACPGSDLRLTDTTETVAPGDEPAESNPRILSGYLQCPHCNATYPIVQGIPRFVDVDALHAQGPQQVQGDIAQNFGDAWQLYAQERRNPYTEAQFLDWIAPLAQPDFHNKVVLDMGCGLAGFAEYAATYQPRLVVGLEISHAIDAAAPLQAEHDHLFLVQGDLLHPPFKPGCFDLIYSIGVLHHLESPVEGFQTTVPLLSPGGRLFIWVYGRENNGLVIYGIDPLRKILSRLPVRQVRQGVAFPLSLILFPLLHTVYHPLFRPLLGWLPYAEYFYWLRQHGFGYVVGMITDQLIPPRTHYLTRLDVQSWYARCGLGLESLTPRNNMSWRALGRNLR